MALQTEMELLNQFILQMRNEGLVNNQFIELQSCKEPNSPDFVIRTVLLYCKEVERLFACLSFELDQLDLEFSFVQMNSNDLYERSNSIGAESLKIICVRLLNFAQMQAREDCAQALLDAKREFTKLKTNFETLVKMERNIIEITNGNVTRTLSLDGPDAVSDELYDVEMLLINVKESCYYHNYDTPDQKTILVCLKPNLKIIDKKYEPFRDY